MIRSIRKRLRSLLYWLAARCYVGYWVYARVREHWLRPFYPAGRRPSRRRGGEPRVIWMADPRPGYSGGLATRIQGIITAWEMCRQQGGRFAIWFRSPFALEDYLLPNEYDWRIREDELDREHARPTVCMMVALNGTSERFARRLMGRRIRRSAMNHIYSDVMAGADDFVSHFHHLFRPAPALQALIDDQLAAIGGRYVAASFRFLQLLGDFREFDPAWPTLPEGSRQALISACLEQLLSIHREHPEASKVLVTSDSTTFLEAAKAAFDWVHVVEGEVSHLDAGEAQDLSHRKLFLDFFMLSRAGAVVLVVGPGMHRSTFPLTAAQVGGAAFSERKFQ